MFIKTNPVSLDLPLSWTRSKTNSVDKDSFRLKMNNVHWISLARIPENQNFKQTISRLQKEYPHGIILRGCPPSIARQLRKRKFEVLPIGQEAIIDLNTSVFNTRSLRQSARSGNRHNSIHKVELNTKNNQRLKQLKKASPHGKKPQLKNLFIDTFNSFTECFVAENKNGWNAAITFSRVNRYKIQAELLIRKTDAASGTMEALLEHVLQYLKSKGYLLFSLGEVPFEFNSPMEQSIKSRILCRVGRTMHFAYNSATLFKFKNKFSPHWQTVYLCGYPKISLLSLIEMGIRTNYLKLIIFQWINYNKKLVKKIFTGRRIN